MMWELLHSHLQPLNNFFGRVSMGAGFVAISYTWNGGVLAVGALHGS